MDRRPRWISTETASAEVGFSAFWVRQQIYAGRLRATAFTTGKRRTFRIRTDDWDRFLAEFSGPGDAPDARE